MTGEWPSDDEWQPWREKYRFLRDVRFFEDIPHFSVVEEVAATWVQEAPHQLRFTDAGTVEEFLDDAQDIAVTALSYNECTFHDATLWDDLRAAVSDSLDYDHGEPVDDVNAAKQFYAFAAILASHRSSVAEVAHAVRTFHTFNLEALLWFIQAERLRGPRRILVSMPRLSDEAIDRLSCWPIRCLSCSNTSQVFLAVRRDTKRKRLAVVKIFHPPSSDRGDDPSPLFEREEARLRVLAERGVVPPVIRTDPATRAIVFRYRKETTARDLYRTQPPPVTFTRRLIHAALSTLAEAHRLGFVHAAVNPYHLLIRNDASGVRVFICDWHAAHHSDDPAATSHAPWPRHPLFASPHMLRGGEPTPGCDVYALGLTFLELVSGFAAFSETPLPDLLQEHEKLVTTRLAGFNLPDTLRGPLLALLTEPFPSAGDALTHPVLRSLSVGSGPADS